MTFELFVHSMKKYKLTNILLATVLMLIIVTPAVAGDPSEQVEGVNWTSIFKSLVEFIATLFESAAELVRKGAETLLDWF